MIGLLIGAGLNLLAKRAPIQTTTSVRGRKEREISERDLWYDCGVRNAMQLCVVHNICGLAWLQWKDLTMRNKSVAEAVRR